MFYHQYTSIINFSTEKVNHLFQLTCVGQIKQVAISFDPKKCYHMYGFYYCKLPSSWGKYCIVYYWVLSNCNQKYIADFDLLNENCILWLTLWGAIILG